MTTKLEKPFRDLIRGRTCTTCHAYRDRSFFYDHPTGLNGLGSRCKPCISGAPISPRKKELYNKRRKANVCVKCGRQPTVNKVFCEHCWFICEATKQAGGAKNTRFVIKLWKQQEGRCFYTNEPLVPGLTASLDHQQPRCRGGQNTTTNLRWVSKRINSMKTDMSHEEFVKTCVHIATKFASQQDSI